MKKTNRGGPRKGAGRHTGDGAKGMKRYNVSLDPETVETARQIGGGNISQGIRLAVKRQKNDMKNS